MKRLGASVPLASLRRRVASSSVNHELAPEEKAEPSAGTRLLSFLQAGLGGLVPRTPTARPSSSASAVPSPAPPPGGPRVLAGELSRREANARAAEILARVVTANTPALRLVRLEELTSHLVAYPESRRLLDARDAAVPTILGLQETAGDAAVQAKARQTLALLGHAPPLLGGGIRLLSIDGGGVRGLMTLELLGALEAATGRRIHELFDLVVGVSTGAIIATLLSAQRLTVAQARDIYKDISRRLFSQSRVSGVSGLLWAHSYYDTPAWIAILKDAVGEQFLWESAKVAGMPKLCFVSCVVNRNVLEAWVFRNFHQPADLDVIGVGFRLWEALQASAAAPGYFQEVKLGALLHQDGGVLANNPTNVGIEEAKVLWGHSTPLECVVSVGNGRCFQPHSPASEARGSSWKEIAFKMVDSATDTEMTHRGLNNILPSDSYFRLNPYCSETYYLDEIEPARMQLMIEDAKFYVRKNQRKIQAAADLLTKPKPLSDRLRDTWQSKKAVYLKR